MIKTVIADDEVLARRALRTMLATEDGIEIVGECRDGHEVVAMVRGLQPDLLFLDIHMPGLDGFGALDQIRPAPVVIFVTAHGEHALRAFDVSAADYLLKPFDDDRLLRALQRARLEVQRRRIADLVTGHEPARPVPVPERSDRIAVKDGAGVELIEAHTIDWITALDYYAELNVAGRALLLREPLRDLESRLDPQRFVRIHRSTIVNVDRVRRIDRLDHGDFEVTLVDGTRLRMSRSRRPALERLLPR